MYVLLVLYFGVLAYRTYKMVVQRCLPADSCVLTVVVDVSEDMHIVKADIYRSCVVLRDGRCNRILLYNLR